MIKFLLFCIVWQIIGAVAFYIDCKIRKCKQVTILDFVMKSFSGPSHIIYTLFNLCFDSDDFWREYKSPYKQFREEFKENTCKWLMSKPIIVTVYEFFTKDRKI